jgi:general secretion pathway protein D
MKRNRRIAAWVGIMLLAGLGTAIAASTWTVPSGETDLRELTRLVSQATGRTILYGADFQGSVVIEGPRKPVSATELWRLYLSALAKAGWGVVVHGQVVRLVPRSQMAGQDMPVVIGPTAPGEDADGMVTATFELNHLDPSLAAMQLTPLLGPDEKLVPLPAQGRLVVVASAANVEKIRQLLGKLDTPDKREALEVIRLKRANSETIADLLRRLFAEVYYADGRFKRREAAGGLVVIAETGTSSVIVRGEKRDVNAAVKVVRRIDEATDPLILIEQLGNARGDNVAAVLQTLIK